MIEAEVFGDPAGMRALARAIAGRAGVIGAIPGGFGSALGGTAFEGPAADRIRGACAVAGGGVAAAAAELNGIAAALMGDAATVEQMNEDAKKKADAANAAEKKKLEADGDGGGGPQGDDSSGPSDQGSAP